MKNLSLGLLALFFCVPASHSEVIDSVLFNPSRLGRYEDLKVSSELNAPGGVSVQESSTVQSKSSVTVTSPAYELTNASAQQVSLPNTRFDTPVFTVGGGSASFTSGQVQELKDAAGKMIRVKGNIVNVTGNVHVNMTGGKDVSGGDVKGLKLGGNDIPRPGEGCEELGWYAYKTTSGKEYKVLGFKKCAGEEEEECTKTCGAGYTLNEEKCECEKDACKLTCDPVREVLNEKDCVCEEKCIEGESQEQACNQDVGGPAWNWNTCTCDCPTGYVWNDESYSCECENAILLVGSDPNWSEQKCWVPQYEACDDALIGRHFGQKFSKLDGGTKKILAKDIKPYFQKSLPGYPGNREVCVVCGVNMNYWDYHGISNDGSCRVSQNQETGGIGQGPVGDYDTYH